MTTLISGPLSLGDLLDRAFRLYRSRFVILLLTAAIFQAPLSVVSGLLTGRFLVSYMDAIQTLMATPDGPSEAVFGALVQQMIGLGGMFALLSLIGLLVNACVTLALTAQNLAILRGESLHLGEGIRRGMRRFGAFVWMSILELLGIAGATLAFLIPVGIVFTMIAAVGVMLGMNFFQEGSGVAIAGSLILLLCGYAIFFVLLIAPTLYLSARWIAATPALVAENLGPLEALSRSWRLTKGNVLRALGYQILLYLITTLVLAMPVALIQQIIILLLPTSSLAAATAASNMVAASLSIVWTPFSVAAIVLLYYDLRVRHEGFDLELRVAEMEQRLPPPDVSP